DRGADLGDVHLERRQSGRAGGCAAGDLLEHPELLGLERLRLQREGVKLRGGDGGAERLLRLRDPDEADLVRLNSPRSLGRLRSRCGRSRNDRDADRRSRKKKEPPAHYASTIGAFRESSDPRRGELQIDELELEVVDALERNERDRKILQREPRRV